MYEITPRQAAFILELLEHAWKSGAIRSPQVGAEAQGLAALLSAKPKEAPPVKEKPE